MCVCACGFLFDHAPATPLFAVCTESGKMYSFGSNKYGELGLSHGGPQATATPTLVESIKGSVARVACGRLHSAAIDGEWVVCVA